MLKIEIGSVGRLYIDCGSQLDPSLGLPGTVHHSMSRTWHYSRPEGASSHSGGSCSSTSSHRLLPGQGRGLVSRTPTPLGDALTGGRAWDRENVYRLMRRRCPVHVGAQRCTPVAGGKTPRSPNGSSTPCSAPAQPLAASNSLHY